MASRKSLKDQLQRLKSIEEEAHFIRKGLPLFIRSDRERRGVSQKAVCVELGISPAFMCDVEYGRRQLSLSMIDRLLEIL